MFATLAKEVVSRTKQNISAKKTMVTIFFTSTRLLASNLLPKSTKVNQDYFNSMCHNGVRITEKLEKRHIARAPHPRYSPDLSPGDVWLFGILKQKMKERVFQSEKQLLAAVTESWNELTFEDIQRIFHNWMERLISAIANNGEYYQS
jgi:hypothetical protein